MATLHRRKASGDLFLGLYKGKANLRIPIVTPSCLTGTSCQAAVPEQILPPSSKYLAGPLVPQHLRRDFASFRTRLLVFGNWSSPRSFIEHSKLIQAVYLSKVGNLLL